MSDSDQENKEEKTPDSVMDSGSTVRIPPSELDADAIANAETSADAGKPDLDTTAVSMLTRKPLRKYRFIRSIGRGGMKMVLQVRDLDTTRDVAMAVLRDAAARPEEDLRRFVQEARLTARLEHPNIVPVHEIGMDLSGAPYFTMKLLHGRTLASLIEKLAAGDPAALREYRPYRMLRLFIKICHGVAFAHSQGVIHLDLKPENIQVGDFGELLILDWGLAKVIEKPGEKLQTQEKTVKLDPSPGYGNAVGKTTRLSARIHHGVPPATAASMDDGVTEDGVMKGTPGYMAPEQAAGKNSQKDRRTDIYALGAILYAMMTFQDPIGKKNVREKIGATLAGDIVPPRERSPEREIPAAVEAIIQKAMSLNPDDRYQSVHELRDEVNAFIGGYATMAEKASFAKKILLFLKRHILLTAVMIPTAFLLVAGITHVIQERSRFRSEWRTVAVMDFSSGKNGGYHIGAPLNREKRRPRLTGNESLILKSGEWLWLDRSVPENFKLKISLDAGEETPLLDVCIRARDIPLDSPDDFPPGYTFRLGALNGTRDFLFRHSPVKPDPGPVPDSRPRALASAPTLLIPGHNTFSILRKGETLRLSRPGRTGEIFSVTDFFEQDPGGAIGIRILGGPVEILSVKLQQESLPERPSPLLKGDVLSEAGLYDQAFDRYLDAAELYKNSAFSDEALVRAARIAAFKLSGPGWRNDAFLRKAFARIKQRPAFFRKAQIRDVYVLLLWLQGRYSEAFRQIDSILAADPENDILQQILILPRPAQLPPEAAEKLLYHLARRNKTAFLDLSGLGIRSLDPLKKLPLVWLNCSFNPLSSLEGTENMPLYFLDCRNNPDLTDPEAAFRSSPPIFLFDEKKSK